MVVPDTTGRRRRTPEESREEILDAAERALWESSLSELTVGGLMATTRLGRSSFYIHFKDTGELAAALLERLEAQLWEPASLWTSAEAADPDGLLAGVEGTVDVWVRHGPVLRAIVEASLGDPSLHRLWRLGVIDRFVAAVAEGIRLLDPSPAADPEEIATALILLNERYLMDRLGRTPQADPAEVTSALCTIWLRVLYPAPRPPDSDR